MDIYVCFGDEKISMNMSLEDLHPIDIGQPLIIRGEEYFIANLRWNLYEENSTDFKYNALQLYIECERPMVVGDLNG